MQGQYRPAKKGNFMLTKQTGPSQVVIASTNTSVTGTVTLSTFDGSIVRKVRVAVTNSPILIDIGNDTNECKILMPTFSTEHFTLDNTSTVSYSSVFGQTINSFVSFTPVA